MSFLLPLQHAPILVQAGVGRHGRSGARSIEQWRLPELWCLHFYDYHAQLQIGDEAFAIAPGSVSLAPPATNLIYTFESRVEHFYAHFSLESAAHVACANGQFWFAPAAVPPDFARGMQRLIQPTNASPQRAQVALWELLWQLAELSPPSEAAGEIHPSLQRALALIEARLESEIVIAALAREVGLSHNHLTRLCAAHTGQTVVGYVRARRAERAVHLLRHSTLPIGTIAAQVGVPSLGQFNHLMRAQTGLSPRAIRSEQRESME